MDKSFEIQVNEKTFKLGFGLEVFVSLSELWNLETLEEVNDRIQVLTQFEAGKTSLKNLKIISEVMEALVNAHMDNQETLTAREIRCLDMVDFQKVLTTMIDGFVKTMPQPQETDDDESEKKEKAQVKK